MILWRSKPVPRRDSDDVARRGGSIDWRRLDPSVFDGIEEIRAGLEDYVASESPVTGKIVVLVCIILFLQWKPGGLFSIRSRSLD